MTDSTDGLLILLLGSGWSEKKVRETLGAIKRSDPEEALRRFRTLKRALAKIPNKTPLPDDHSAVDRAMKILNSVGPYSENEIAELLSSRVGSDLYVGQSLPKGGLRTHLTSLADRLSGEELVKIAAAIRNDLAHNPRPGWSLKDVK